MTYFETGLVVIKGEKIPVYEITVNATRELTPMYFSDSKEVHSIRSGRKKIDFTIRRALDGRKLSEMYERGCEFTLVLYNNDVQPPMRVMTLEGCVFSKDQASPFDGNSEVKQDLEGQAKRRIIHLSQVPERKPNVC